MYNRNKRKQVLTSWTRARGFTLLELMIVLGIVAIMASIAVPSFTRMIRGQRVLAASNAMIAAIKIARNEAITRGVSVSLCPTDNPNATTPVCNTTPTGWQSGWLIFPTAAGAGSLIRIGEPQNGVTMNNPGQVDFDNRGIPTIGGSPVDPLNTNVAVNATSCDTGKDKEIIVNLGVTGTVHSTASTCP